VFEPFKELVHLLFIGAIHVGTRELRIDKSPGSVANKTGLGQVLIVGVFADPGGP